MINKAETNNAPVEGPSNNRRMGWLAPKIMRRRTFSVAVFACVLAALYWGVIASDRYVSEAHVVVQRTDLASGQTVDFSSVLGNLGGNNFDQQVLQDYLLSTDMLGILDTRLNLRAHFSDKKHDLLSRLWAVDLPKEKFYEYYLDRVSVELDGTTGILILKAQGFSPEMAHAIASQLVVEGERYINSMVHRLAKEQVAFLEEQVERMSQQANSSRKVLLDFQNKYSLASPERTAENLAGIIGSLEAQYSTLQTQLSALQGYLMPDSPKILELQYQAEAIEKQLAQEKARLTSVSGSALNERIEEYQRLQMEAEYSQEIYKTALKALEVGRIDTIRTLKKVSIIQQPTLPQYSTEPRRTYNTIVFVLVALMLAGIVHMLAAIIRDHKD